VSLLEPTVAFLSDELSISRKKAVAAIAGVTFALCQFPIFLIARGVMDDIDFWAGSFFLVVFGAAECVIFVWVFGIEKAWDEIHHGSELRIPRFYKPVIQYVTPTFLILILGFWVFQQAIPTFRMDGVPRENVPYIWATRIGLLLLFIVIAVLVRKAYRKKFGGER
jgi:SNF family Na+-dependent transporter